MPSPEYHGIERRQNKLEEDMASLARTSAEQSQIVSKLLAVSENNAAAMARLESWVITHEADYRAVRERLLSQELMGSSISQRLVEVTAALENVTKAYLSDRNRVVGAWAAAGSASAFILGLVAVAKAFGAF